MGVFQNNLMGAAAAAGGAAAADFYDYQIANSARFIRTGDNANTYLKRTPSSAGNRKTYTLSLWVKRTQTTNLETFASAQVTATTNYVDGYKFGTALYDNSGLSLAAKGAVSGSLITTASYRDTSAWMHIVIRMDSTQATAANRLRLYVNGEQVTAFGTETYIPEDYEGGFCSTREHAIGWGTGANNGQGFFGYMAEVILADGTSYAPTQFGESKNGVWIPKDPSGTSFGTTGFHLDFAASGDLGNDVSGNNNDFTNVGMQAHDQMLDSPTFNSDSNGGNFATYNPLQEKGTAQALMVLTEGNLQAESVTSDKYHQIIGNMGVKTGKWYIEWYILAAGYPSWAVGWHYGDGLELFNGSSGQAGTANMAYMGYFTGSTVYLTPFGNTGTNPVAPSYSSFTNQGAPTTGDVIMCAIDYDAGKGWWGINGVWGDVGSGTGNPATGANASLTWTASDYTDYKFPFTLSWASPVAKIVMNCGQEGTFGGAITAGGNADDTGYGNFKYDVPAGFLALCSGNLPTADAVDPAQTDADYPQKLFSATIWTGNGSGRTISSGSKSDAVWIKRRNGAAAWAIQDSTRGTSAALEFNTTAQEDTSFTQGVTAFGSSSFNIGTHSQVNNNSDTYVGYAIGANGGTTSTNSNGSISVTQQVDPSGGFSISTYSGTAGTPTIGHGLSSAPTFVIVKQRNGTHNWAVYAKGAAATKYGFLESTSGFGTDNMWGNTTPSSTLVYLGAYTQTHGSGRDYVAYCFADTEGYIKSGSYEGNGNVDGAFIYTGFKPAFILIKGIDANGTGWNIHDNATSPINLASTALQTNTSSAELSNYNIDMLSNGFKIRDADGDLGTNGNKYIYVAMAENPFKYATAR